MCERSVIRVSPHARAKDVETVVSTHARAGEQAAVEARVGLRKFAEIRNETIHSVFGRLPAKSVHAKQRANPLATLETRSRLDFNFLRA